MEAYAVPQENLLKTLLTLNIELMPSMFFLKGERGAYEPYFAKLSADTDFRAYVDKLAAVFAYAAAIGGSSAKEVAAHLVAQTKSDTPVGLIDQEASGAFGGLFETEKDLAFFVRRENLWCVALFLLSITPHLGNWSNILVPYVPESEEKVKTK